LGIGNFQFISTGAEPTRRLEILDADPATGTNANAPQLRLTYQYNTSPANGIFSEFQTTSIGDLYFNTRGSVNARRFGFHDNTPGNTVEISSQNGVPYFGTANGSSGLRFTNLTSANTPVANGTNGVNSAKLLTVDQNGDVVLTNASPAVTTAQGITFNPTSSTVELGAPCPAILPNVPLPIFTSDRIIAPGNFNLNFVTGPTQSGRTGFGNTANFCTPGNTVEIGANLGSAYGNGGVNGSSGLRFTKLTSAHTPLANGVNGVNNAKVLSVDQNGDVVLVNSNTGVGNYCGQTPTNALTGNYDVPLNTFNYYFTGQGYKNNALAVGFNCGVPLKAKFNVFEQSGFISTTTADNLFAGLIAINDFAGANFQRFVAVHGESKLSDPNGVAFRASHIGGNFDAGGGWYNYGIKTDATGGINTINFGGYFNAASSTLPAFNYAVYGNAQAPNGTSTSNNNHYAGFFNGGVYMGQIITASDELMKRDKNLIANAASKIALIDPISFNFDTVLANQKGMSLPGGLQYGFKAQQLETIYPELVTMVHKPETRDSSGNITSPDYDFKGINYIGFIALLTKAVQEQQIKIAQLDSVINSCCNSSTAQNNSNQNSTNKIPTYEINIGNDDLPMLAQNIPNPYGNTTNIQFNIPKNSTSAQIVFFNEQGMILNSVEINTKGRGQLNVNAEMLENGLYFYSLIIDGKKVDTKKMVKAE
jgi:hypothetical protein